MWQLKMLFALGAVCFKLTVRQIKTEGFQICFRKKPFGVWGFGLTPFSLSLGASWDFFGGWWITGGLSLKASPWFLSGCRKRKRAINEDFVCFPCRVSLLRQRPPTLLPGLRCCPDLLWHQSARNPGQRPKKGKFWASLEHRALLDKLILKSLQWCCSYTGKFHFVLLMERWQEGALVSGHLFVRGGC